MSEPEDRHVNAALRLAREHFYQGYEPYGPAVMGFARMLAAYEAELPKPADSFLRGACLALAEKWREDDRGCVDENELLSRCADELEVLVKS